MAAEQGTRRQVLIPDEIWDSIGRLADIDTTSKSATVRKACKVYIDLRTKPRPQVKKSG